ncbi:MAG: hypothetical protein IKJ77_09720 [Firmicutes bacterium]|nr:hypothetical protein [Bacillota bacterium]
MNSMKRRAVSWILILAMVFTTLFGNAAMVFADTPEPSETVVTTEADLSAALAAGGEVKLGGDITVNTMIEIPAGVTATLDLNGYAITSGYQTGSDTKHIYPLDVWGNLTIKDTDTEGDGSITGRGIYVQNGAKLTVDSGSIFGIDSNGGSALYQYGGEIVINGGLIEQRAEGTHNFAVNAATGIVTVYGGKIAGNHGAIAAVGAAVVIYDGEFVCTGSAGVTDNVLYTSGSGSITINGGTFIADSDTPAGGCCVYDANGGTTIYGGNFSNSSGGDVWGTTGTEINGGTFENLTETDHVTVGATITNGGTKYTKTEDGLEEYIAEATIGSQDFGTLEEAVAVATAGDEIVLNKDVTLDAALTLPAGVTLNGNGKQINGTVNAGGDITFKGHTKVTAFSAGYYDRVVTIGEGACLEITGTGRATVGYGNTFNITGTIEDAKTVDKTAVQPSLIIPGGISITGGNDAAFNVTNAYIKLGNTSSKNSVANGEFDLNFKNSIVEFTNQFTLAEPTGGNAPTFNVNIKDSVVTTAAKLCIAAPDSNVVVDNSTVTLGSYLRNSGDLTIQNGSSLTGSMIQFGENGGNDGTITVDDATLTIDNDNPAYAMDGNGTGKIIVVNGGKADIKYVQESAISIDTDSSLTVKKLGADTSVEVDVSNWDGVSTNFITGDLSGAKGNITVKGNEELAADVDENGNIEFKEAPFVQIGDVKYDNLTDALKDLQANDELILLRNITITEDWDCRPASKNGDGATFDFPVTINGNNKTLKFTGKISDGYNHLAVFRFNSDATVKNLTVDMSEAQAVFQNRFTVISTNGNLDVDNCTFIGNSAATRARAIMFGEVAGEPNASDVVVNKSNFTNWYRGVVDNMNGKDVKSVELTGNTFTNADVYVSASDEVVFNNNTMNTSGVDIRSYSAENKLSVEANGNTLAAPESGKTNSIIAKEINAQEGFELPIVAVDGKYYFTLKDAFNKVVNGSTVTLLDDVTIDTETYTIADGTAVTLDMNGKKITVTDSKESNNYELFYILGEMTVNGEGTIELKALHDRDWNAMSTIFHNRGGVLNIENGTFKHLGGTDMAYVVDNSGNYYGDATTNIEDGTLDSTYIAIRNRMEQNSHGASGTAYLNVSGGKITGPRRAIWGQASSTSTTSPATGEINITGGEIGLIETDCSAGAVSMTKISGGTVAAVKCEVGELTVTGGTVGTVTAMKADGTEVPYTVGEDGKYVEAFAQIGDVKYATLDEAFKAAKDKDEVKILQAGIYALSTSGKDITITGAVDGVVFDNIGKKNMSGANVTFNNVTFDYYPNVNYTGLQHSGDLVYNDCTFDGQVFLYGTSETFNECTFNQNSKDAYNVWTYSAKEVAFNDCKFNSSGKSVLIYHEDAKVFNDVAVTDCDFNASQTVDGKAAIEMDSSLSGGINLTIDEKTTATGFDEGNVSGNTLWNNKKGNDKTEANNDITVVVDNEPVLEPVKVVAKIGNTIYDDLHKAMVAAKSGETVVLVDDVDLAGTEWEPVSFKGTFDGQGHTIKNLTINKPGVQNTGFITSLNGTFKNVTFTNPTVTGGECTGVVAGRAGGSATLVENITVNGTIKVETTHSGYARAGVIVGGWAYGNYKDITVDGGDKAVSYIKHTGGGDGRYVAGIVGHADGVESYVNCTVKNITISGGWLCGGIAGPGPSNGLASDCTVENIDMGADYSGGMFGWYYGSGTIEDSTVTDVTFTDGNTNNGAIGGYSNNASANVSNVIINNVKNEDGTPLLNHFAKIGDTYYNSLQEAIDAAKTGDTIVLLRDVTEDVVITQQADLDLTIDGDGKTFTGTMTVFGNGRQAGAETLTIKNVNFQAVGVQTSCIVSPDRTVNNKYSYAHNVTVDNCTFKGDATVAAEERATAAIRTEDGGDMNWTITNCTVDENMHSFLQVQNIEGKLTIKDCEASSKNGINLNCTTNVEMTGCTIEVEGYAVRAGVKSGGNLGEEKNYVLNNNVLKSKCDDGDAVIMLRASAVDMVVNMEENVVSGTTHISGTTGDTKVTAENNYWDGQNQPVVSGTAVTVGTYYVDEAKTKKDRNCGVAGIDHKYEAEVTAPTCTTAGYTTYACDCGASYKDDIVEALGHDWNEGEVTTEPTCTKEGVKTFTCQNDATHTKTEAVAKVAHEHEAVVTEPTCTTAGYTTYTCECGDTYKKDVVEALGHKWDAGKVTTEPTCTKEGVKTFTCQNDATHTRTEAVAKVAHSYKTVVTEPTCQMIGYTTYTCECGDSYIKDLVPAKAHEYKAVVTAPTCEDAGYTTKTCDCGHSYVTDITKALGHKWDAGKVTTEPTCTKEGVKTFTCQNDAAHTRTEAVAKAAHAYKAVVTAPTCEDAGYTTNTCACGDTYVTAITKALGHKWDAGKVTTEATCTAEGVKTFTCQNDAAHTRTDAIAKLAHSYKAVVTAPTCTAEGYTTYTCVCGDTYTGDKVAALGHSVAHTEKTRATTTENGQIVATCSCGTVISKTTIHKVESLKLSISEATYSGKRVTPSLTIKDSEGNKLKKGTDYKVGIPKYRKNVGKYRYKITFMGNYSGTEYCYLTINPKAPTIKAPKVAKRAVTVKWNKVSKQATGYQVMVATDKKFSKNKKSVTVKGYKMTSKKISNLKADKTYFVKVRTYKTVKGVKFYSDWSKVRQVKTK